MAKKKKNGPNRSQKDSYQRRLHRQIVVKNNKKEVELAQREAEVAKREAAVYKQQVEQLEQAERLRVEQAKPVEQPAAGHIMSPVFLEFCSFIVTY